MIVLACDPSLRAFGWAIFDSRIAGSALECLGVIETTPDKNEVGVTKDNARRFDFIAKSLWDVATKWKPESIYVEGQVFMTKTNFSALASAGHSRGLVTMLGAAFEVAVTEFSPQAVKKGLGIAHLGAGLASKDEVRKAVERLYPNASELMPDTKVGAEAASDACAVGHVGIKQAMYLDSLRSASSW